MQCIADKGQGAAIRTDQPDKLYMKKTHGRQTKSIRIGSCPHELQQQRKRLKNKQPHKDQL